MPSSRAKRFLAASTARSGERAVRITIDRWQHRNSRSLRAISLKKQTR
jgi:hypothetical protein